MLKEKPVRKRLTALLTFLMTILLLVACGGGAADTNTGAAAVEDEPVTKAEEIVEEVAEDVEAEEAMEEEAMEEEESMAVRVGQITDVGGINDASFNELAWAGLQDAELDFGVEVNFLESQQQTDYEKNINEFIQQGYDLIVTVGFLLGDATAAAAEANPDTAFAIIDVNYLEDSAGNILQSQFAVDEASFLAGYLAAGVSETGKVGTFGGVNIPPVVQFMVGFEHGVNHYNEVHGTEVEVLGWSTEDGDGLFTGNFESLDDGRTFAESLFDEGADIILPVAGPVGLGAAAAAQDRGLMMIGVDQDWYESAPDFSDVYLTSVLKRVDLVGYQATQAVVDGTFEGGLLDFTLANNGVELAPYHDQADRVTPELQGELDQLKEDLIADTIGSGWAEFMGAPPQEEVVAEEEEMMDTSFEWPEGLATDGPLAGVDPTGQTVTWWHNHSGGREELLLEIVNQFNSENPYDITIEAVNQGGYDDIREKMGAGIVSGDLPGIVVGYQNDQAFYASVDALVDMDTYVNDAHWGLSEEARSDFVEGIFFQDVHPAFDDMRLGLAPNRSMEVLFYNKTWMEELGFDPEATITPELFEEVACAAAAERGDGEGGYIIRFDASQVAAAALAYGADVLTEDGLMYQYNTPELAEYLTQIKRMYDNGCAWVSPENFHDAEFAARQGIFNIGSTSGLPFAQGSMDDASNSDEWDIAPQPYTTDEPRQNLYGGSVSMPKGTPEQQLASWIFIDWFTSPEPQAEWVKASNYFSPRLSTSDLLEDYVETNPKYQTALEMLPYASFEPQLISYADVRNLVSEVFNEIITGDRDIQEALEAIDEEANEIHAEFLE